MSIILKNDICKKGHGYTTNFFQLCTSRKENIIVEPMQISVLLWKSKGTQNFLISEW